MKIAIVTGASSGMGREFARQIENFYQELDEIWVIARRKERLEELQHFCKCFVRIVEGDLQTDEFYSEIEQLLAAYQPEICMLVNAAGFGKSGEATKISVIDQCDMVTLNCKALTHMTMLSIPYMKRESHIVNLASAAAFCPQPGFSVYAATKSYVLSFSRSLRAEVKNMGIHVTAVCPGPVNTEFFETSGKMKEGSMKAAVMVQAEDVVRKALQDATRNKELSVYGIPMKCTRFAIKILPHRFLVQIMKKFM